MDQRFNEMQTVKRCMFAMRNGVIADTLRKAGSGFSIIFGLNLPQIAEIAEQTDKDAELARKLWANTTTRESLLLAPMLMPVDEFEYTEALAWAMQSPCTEVSDILCHRLLRHLPFAGALVDDLVGAGNEMCLYTGLRLMCNIYRQNPEKAMALGTQYASHPGAVIANVARILLD